MNNSFFSRVFPSLSFTILILGTMPTNTMAAACGWSKPPTEAYTLDIDRYYCTAESLVRSDFGGGSYDYDWCVNVGVYAAPSTTANYNTHYCFLSDFGKTTTHTDRVDNGILFGRGIGHCPNNQQN